MSRALICAAAIATSGCGHGGSSNNGAAPGRQAPIAFEGATASPSARLAQGERLTYVLGCRGCHGSRLEGHLWDHDPRGYGVMWASNLTRAVAGMTDAQLRALLTQGVHPRRGDLWVMPSELFQHLAEPDLIALIAYLRSLPPGGAVSPDPRPGPRALREIASGEARPAAAVVRETRATLPADAGPDHALGRYITSVTCAECHGHRLEGHRSEEGSTPDLNIVGAYSREEFERLITRGEAKGGRRIAALMVGVATGRFSRLTQGERDALYFYLRARAALPQ
jgi:cytochrome c5